nr:hypothetical protein [Tanacetum cinerariifolium]
FVSYSTMILEKLSLYKEIHEVDHHKKNDWRLCFGCILKILGDGASWSIVVKEGELVDTTGSGATTSAIGVMTLGVDDQH